MENGENGDYQANDGVSCSDRTITGVVKGEAVLFTEASSRESVATRPTATLKAGTSTPVLSIRSQPPAPRPDDF